MAKDKRLERAEKHLENKRAEAAGAVSNAASDEVVHTAMNEYAKAVHNRDAAEVMVNRSQGK